MLLIRWPDEDQRRPEHAGQVRPTLLLLERGGPAPRRLGAMEDWVFDDAAPEEVALRVAILAGRSADRFDGPVVEGCLLRHGERWTAVSEAQLPLVELLVENFDRVVLTATLAEAYAGIGGSIGSASMRSLFHRLGHRFAEVGLELRRIRGRGVSLTVPSSSA